MIFIITIIFIIIFIIITIVVVVYCEVIIDCMNRNCLDFVVVIYVLCFFSYLMYCSSYLFKFIIRFYIDIQLCVKKQSSSSYYLIMSLSLAILIFRYKALQYCCQRHRLEEATTHVT